MTKVYLGTCHAGQIPFGFGRNREVIIYKLVAEHMYGGRAEVQGCRIDHNRNGCVEKFLQSECDYLLFLDDDMLFPPEVGVRLASHEKDIVCGLYFQRHRESPHPHWYKYQGYRECIYGQMGHGYASMIGAVRQATEGFPRVDGPVLAADGPLLPIDAGGTGCTMISRKVLETMKPPWFRSEGATNGDLQFFYKAKELGFDVWGDPSVVCAHCAWEPIGLASFHNRLGAYSAPAPNTKEYWEGVHAQESYQTRIYSGLPAIVEHVIDSFNGKIRMADFGCGISATAEYTNGKVELVGIDFAESAQRENRKRHPEASWIVADVRNCPLASGSVDLSFSNSVIEHIEEPLQLTDEMWRVLRPGGAMVLGIPLNLPHPEHTHVYDWDAAIEVGRKYSPVIHAFPLGKRAVLAIEKE